MDQKSQELLDKYIGRLLELKDAKSSQFSQKELKEIALEIGLTEADLKVAREEVESHLKRGKTYLHASNWQLAEQEFVQARELDPVNISTLYQLAEFYFKKWKKTGKQKEELDQAIQQCLNLQADYVPVKNLLGKVKRAHGRKRLGRRAKRVFVAVFLPIALLAGYIFLKEIEVIKPAATGLEGLEYQVPTEVSVVSNLEGVDLEMNRFTIKHDESVHRQRSFDYDYFGNITSSIYEVHKLRFRAEFLDQNGNLLADDFLWLFNANSPYTGDNDRFTLHPKDRFLFYGGDFESFKNTPAKVAKVVLIADKFERFRPAANYPDYKPVELIWLVQQVEYLDFEVRERTNAYYNDEYGRPRHYLDFEIVHKGAKPCRELLLLVEWMDEKGNVVEVKTISVISLKHKPVEPRERLIVQEIKYFDEDTPKDHKPFASYRVSVKTAD